MKKGKVNPTGMNRTCLNKTGKKLVAMFMFLLLLHIPKVNAAEGDDIMREHHHYAVYVVSENPAIIEVYFNHDDADNVNYWKTFKLYATGDNGIRRLLFEEVTIRPVPENSVHWYCTTPYSVITHKESDNTGDGYWHHYQLHFDVSKNMKFEVEGIQVLGGEDNVVEDEGNMTFPAPEAPEIEVSPGCDGNTISWSEPDLGGISGSVTYRVDWGDGSTSTSALSYTHNTGTKKSYKVRTNILVDFENEFVIEEGDEDYVREYNLNENFYALSSYSGPQSATPLRPNVPTDLAASTDKCTEIKIDWKLEGSPDAVNVFRNGVEVGQVGGMFRTFTDEPPNPENGTSYSYTVQAVNQGCTGSQSSSISGRTYGTPSAPGNFNAAEAGNAINLSWNDSDIESRYIIKRSSASGATEFELSENETSYTDNAVNGCEEYTYQLYAGNQCTEAGMSGEKATAEPQLKLQPDLSTYITYVDASKAYFPDVVTVEWTVEDDNINLVDAFEVSRTIAGQNDWEMLGAVQGGTMYEDVSAVGGILYEYRVQANLDCEGDFLESNTRTTTGFRLPYGIVNGHIEYEDGVAVSGAEVLAEKASGTPYGNSLLFDGSSSVTVADNEKLNPTEYMLAEAWVQPNVLSGERDIIAKQSGSSGYRLYQNNSDVVFEINIAGTMRSVTAPNVLQTGVFTHVAGSCDSAGVKIYINGEIPSLTSYTITAQDTADMVLMGFEEDIIDELSALLNTEYASFENFADAIPNRRSSTTTLYAVIGAIGARR